MQPCPQPSPPLVVCSVMPPAQDNFLVPVDSSTLLALRSRARGKRRGEGREAVETHPAFWELTFALLVQGAMEEAAELVGMHSHSTPQGNDVVRKVREQGPSSLLFTR